MSSPASWKLFSGNSHPALAQDLASELNVPVEPVVIATCADGEASIRLGKGCGDPCTNPTRKYLKLNGPC